MYIDTVCKPQAIWAVAFKEKNSESEIFYERRCGLFLAPENRQEWLWITYGLLTIAPPTGWARSSLQRLQLSTNTGAASAATVCGR